MVDYKITLKILLILFSVGLSLSLSFVSLEADN